jgi:predicted AAA+ superfamily ATPase
VLIHRHAILAVIETALARSPVVVLAGPRQCGKTTLARLLLNEDSLNHFDLENPASLTRLEEPITALQSLRGLIVIDEVHRLAAFRAWLRSIDP